MDLCIWVELLENSLSDIIHLIISRTENNAIHTRYEKKSINNDLAVLPSYDIELT